MRAVAILVASVSLCAQPAFEVASVKPASPDQKMAFYRGGPGTADPGIFIAEYLSLNHLIRRAFAIKSFQLSGPGWPDSARFSITAKVPPGATREQLPLMLQNLLTERFKLTFHHDKKEMPVYELVVGKNRPKFKESADEAAPGPSRMTIDKGRARIDGIREPMEHFVTTLADQVGRPVSDATGLKGKYDFTLSWGLEGAPPQDDPAPTLFNALADQLGLRLEQKKGMVDILVIDHVEKVPTEN